MYFRVFNKNGNDITNKYSWVITQAGELCYRSYGDLIGMDGVFVVFYFDDGTEKSVFNQEEEI